MGDIYHAGSTYAGSLPIDDTQATATNTWSAQKIQDDRPLVTGSISLPATSTYTDLTVAGATSDMVVTSFYLADPSKVTSSSISFTPSEGKVRVTAVVATGGTTIQMILEKARTS